MKTYIYTTARILQKHVMVGITDEIQGARN